MKDVIFDDFQNAVEESLLRHKSILDIMTKLQESQSRINRALVKCVTNCGCVEINASKQEIVCEYDDIEDLKNDLKTHLNGKLCNNCREVLEREIGNNCFYLSSLCSALDLNMYDILLKQYEEITILGKFSLR